MKLLSTSHGPPRQMELLSYHGKNVLLHSTLLVKIGQRSLSSNVSPSPTFITPYTALVIQVLSVTRGYFLENNWKSPFRYPSVD